MAYQRYRKIALDGMAVSEKLKAETEAAKKQGIANDNARQEAIRRAIPEGFDCAIEDVGRLAGDRAAREAAYKESRRSQQRGMGR